MTTQLSWHSPRRGYAKLAQQQGAQIDDIRGALRQRSPDTTRRYLDPAEGAKPPSPILRLAGYDVPERPHSEVRQRPPEVPHRLADHGTQGGDDA